MSTVFKLLGANSTVNNTIVDEVKRINKLENDFYMVSNRSYFHSQTYVYRCDIHGACTSVCILFLVREDNSLGFPVCMLLQNRTEQD
jgi:hypothetical protein